MNIEFSVKELMDKKIVKLDEKSTVTEAMESMHSEGVWSLIVTRYGKPYGVVTERDFLRRCFRLKLDPSEIILKDIMSFPLITIDDQLKIGSALNLLILDGIRRLYVVDKSGEIIGRVTQTGTLEATLNAILRVQQVFEQQ